MSIQLFDPVFDVELVEHRQECRLDGLRGRRIGYLFNQHVSALEFWKILEREIDREFAPSHTHRLYKTNTWAQAPKAEVDELARQTDYVLVGVGA